MNKIVERENSDEFIRLLRARTKIYSRVKRVFIAQLFFMVVVPIGGAILGILVSEARPWVAVVALLAALLDTVFFDRFQRQRNKSAAKIAEQFDCGVLELPWSSVHAGSRLDPETIEEAFRKSSANVEKLKNWYPVEVARPPLHIARVICQRTNLWYDSTLRRRYGWGALLFAVVVSSGLFAWGLIARLTLLEFVATILVPAAPLLIWAIKEYFRQRDAAEANDPIKGEADALLQQAQAGQLDEATSLARCRGLQDAIYIRRCNSPAIAPGVYWLLRDRMEERMKAGAADMVEAVMRRS